MIIGYTQYTRFLRDCHSCKSLYAGRQFLMTGAHRNLVISIRRCRFPGKAAGGRIRRPVVDKLRLIWASITRQLQR